MVEYRHLKLNGKCLLKSMFELDLFLLTYHSEPVYIIGTSGADETIQSRTPD